MKNHFTSDTHFGHANIIRYSARPWCKGTDFTGDGNDGYWVSSTIKYQRAQEMDEGLITNWNAVVNPDDVVYHLGDFAFGKSNRIIEILRRLNGHIKFVWGNHDQGMKDFKTIQRFYPDLENKIQFLGEQKMVIVEGQQIVVNHYAMRVWEKSHDGSWHLYGHSHGSLADDPHSRSFDVGVDCHNYRPITFDEVKTIIEKKFWKPVDHHGQRQEGGGVGLSKEEYAKFERRKQYEQLKKEFESQPLTS